MPLWLSITFGLVVGVAVVAAALAWAFMPSLKATPPKAVWPEGRELPQDWSNWQGDTLGMNPPSDGS
jgi:hypothetical protein